MKTIITGVFIFISINLLSQTTSKLDNYNLLLSEKFEKIASSKNEKERFEINSEIITLFNTALKEINSFEHPFDSIKQIGIIKSEDEKVRIYTWNIPLKDGTHKYYGFIQYKPKKKKLLTFELNDNSINLTNPENQTLNPKNWFGTLYYKIIETKNSGTTYYTTLGVDMNNWLTTKKIIDVLSFDKENNAKIGASLFSSGGNQVKRIIFEYNSKASMLLRHDIEKEMIIFDHLAPERPSLEGKFEFYGPDFSYDGLKFEDGKWKLIKDLELINEQYEFGNKR